MITSFVSSASTTHTPVYSSGFTIDFKYQWHYVDGGDGDLTRYTVNGTNTGNYIFAPTVTEIACEGVWFDSNVSSYTITYNLNGGTNNGNNKASYKTSDTPVSLYPATRDGYTFAGWYDNAELTGVAITEIEFGLTGNKEYWAKWSEILCPGDQILSENECMCPIGYYSPTNFPELCFPHILHAGTGNVYLRSTKRTSPALHAKVGNDVFYANMTLVPTYMSSESSNYLKTRYNGSVYYICDDTTYNTDLEPEPDTNPTDKQSCSDLGGTWMGADTGCVFD